MEVYSDETYGPYRKKLSMGRNWRVPVYSRLGSHFSLLGQSMVRRRFFPGGRVHRDGSIGR